MAKLNNLTKPLSGSPSSLVWLSQDVSLSYANYQTLLNYICSRVRYAWQKTTSRYVAMNEIDTQLLGDIELAYPDQYSASQNQQGSSPKTTDINLSIGASQLDTVATALIDMLVPTNKMYEPFTDSANQNSAAAVTAKMNRDADEFGHIVSYNKIFSDVLRYDLGGALLEWTAVYGNKLTNGPLNDVVVTQNQEVYSGNKLTALDMRNTFFDPNVAPENVSANGSYAGFVETLTVSQLNELIDQGKLFAEYLDDSFSLASQLVSYNVRPVLHNASTNSTAKLRTHNYDLLFDNSANPDKNISLVTIFIKLRPAQFGLSTSMAPEVWCFRLIGERIVYGASLPNAHARLPIVLTTSTMDSLGEAMIGPARTLIPLQSFASFLVNAKRRSYRKQLYGLTYYDKNRIDMRQVINATNHNDFENAYVPVDVPDGGSIGQVVSSFNDAPDTSSVLTDLANVQSLMQDILPTDSRQALANLSRVSQWQAQRTVRETDKRTIKIARLLNTSLITPIKFISVFNILQFMDSLEIQQPDGSVATVPIAELRDSNIQFMISSALRGIDKDIVADKFRDIINSLLQVPNLTSQFDVTRIIKYWSSLLGQDIDLGQFRIESEFDKLSPQQKQAAYELLAQAAAERQAQQAIEDGTNVPLETNGFAGG